ncbi:MAG: hypothetical protein AAB721_02775 [Patescibacteria group bacterium]
MATLTVLTSKRSANGNDLVGVAAAGGGDVFPNTGKEVVVIKNGGAGAITLTVVTPATIDGLAVADLTATIGVGETRAVGPFPPGVYSTGGVAGGNVSLTYSGVTTVTVAVLALTPEA